MSREEIFNRIEVTAKKVFGENTRITESTTSVDVEKWDSMNHVLLISSIEKEFGVTFDIMEIIGITCFGDFVDLIEKKQP
ncbi:MAG: acyl carrier protein [Verrucomicrobia bacterium]|nr:acyl carrier protein [Prolixibacteraceae bacterium]